MMKRYKKPTLIIDMFDNNDIVLTGSGNPGVDDIKNLVTSSGNGITIDGKSGDNVNNVISLTW